MSNVLKAMERTDFRKSALTKIRKSGHIPAIVYGSEMENRPIYLDGSQFLKTIKKVGKNGIITLDLDGKKKDVILSAIIRKFRSRKKSSFCSFAPSIWIRKFKRR